MDKFQSFFPLLPLLVLISLPQLQLLTRTAAKSFSLELIHRDSRESPFYRGDLTFQERIESYVRISKSRAAYLKSILNNRSAEHPDMMHPPVFHSDLMYIVRLSLGTPAKTIVLMMDTGSDLMWVQCLPCRSCFPQQYPLFDPAASSTYQRIPCQYPVCSSTPFQCVNGICVYKLQYMDESYTKGIAAWETVRVETPRQPLTTLNNIFFGCSHDNHGFPEAESGVMTGILGLSKAPISLISQLGSFIDRRFSYCFVSPLPNGDFATSYLKFGTDMGYRGGPGEQTTKFLNHPSHLYYLSLQDISVDHERVGYPPKTFDIKPSLNGGFIIDSGSALTFLQKDAYWQLHKKFESYFNRFGLEKHTPCSPPFQLCYKLTDKFSSISPSITLHFADANMEIPPENVFIVDEKNYFVVTVVPHDDDINILGSFQQRDFLFTYDLNIDSLSFVPVNCSDDAS